MLLADVLGQHALVGSIVPLGDLGVRLPCAQGRRVVLEQQLGGDLCALAGRDDDVADVRGVDELCVLATSRPRRGAGRRVGLTVRADDARGHLADHLHAVLREGNVCCTSLPVSMQLRRRGRSVRDGLTSQLSAVRHVSSSPRCSWMGGKLERTVDGPLSLACCQLDPTQRAAHHGE